MMAVATKKLKRKIAVAALHILGWAIILLIPRYLTHQSQFRMNLIRELALWLPVIVVFYFNYYILIPKLLTHRKFVLYAGVVFGLIVVSIFSIRLVDRYYFGKRVITPPFGDKREQIVTKGRDSLSFLLNDPHQTFKEPRFEPMDRIPRREFDNLILCILSIAVSTSIKVTEKWYSNEKERKEMENEKLTAELWFLKSQINPHFFFNTLNSIYSLAIQKSDKTPQAIVKLSEIMRYIIYESDRAVVPLRNELEYIKNYVELQRLRLTSNVIVTYDIIGPYQDILIEPLLFLPFIENAFKHGVDTLRKCEIKIKFVITSDQLVFTVENPVVEQRKTQTSESSGIGLANSRKRLQLIYQDRHDLSVEQTKDIFKVVLTIKKGENELYHS
jgi:two-component system, LytTR family, sensor kinase